MDDLTLKFLKDMSLGILYLLIVVVLLAIFPILIFGRFLKVRLTNKGVANDCIYS